MIIHQKHISTFYFIIFRFEFFYREFYLTFASVMAGSIVVSTS